MAPIKNIEGLIKRLNMCSGAEGYLEAMRQIDIPEQEFERYYSWDDTHYTRNQIARTENYELLVMCWEKGQQGFIHDYDAAQAWIHPLRGKLREDRYVMSEAGKLNQVSSVILGPEEFSYMGRGIDIHKYSNAYDGRSVSVHLYAPAVEEWTIYTSRDGNTGRKNVHPDKVNSTEMVSA